MSLFPKDDQGRKMLPIFKMVTGYFPKALREVTRVCVANNVRYNPGRDPADINWARGKSPDQLGSAFRHMMERVVDGTVFEEVPPEVTAATGIERIYVLAEAAWRDLAALELEIEKVEAQVSDPTQGELGPVAVAKERLFMGYCEFDSTLPAPVTQCSCVNCAIARHHATTGV